MLGNAQEREQSSSLLPSHDAVKSGSARDAYVLAATTASCHRTTRRRRGTLPLHASSARRLLDAQSWLTVTAPCPGASQQMSGFVSTRAGGHGNRTFQQGLNGGRRASPMSWPRVAPALLAQMPSFQRIPGRGRRSHLRAASCELAPNATTWIARHSNVHETGLTIIIASVPGVAWQGPSKKSCMRGAPSHLLLVCVLVRPVTPHRLGVELRMIPKSSRGIKAHTARSSLGDSARLTHDGIRCVSSRPLQIGSCMGHVVGAICGQPVTM